MAFQALEIKYIEQMEISRASIDAAEPHRNRCSYPVSHETEVSRE